MDAQQSTGTGTDRQRGAAEGWGAAVWRRLTDRSRWPRRWWYPPVVTPGEIGWDEAACKAQHAKTSDTIRHTMLGLIAFSFFCLLTLGAPDSLLLAGSAKIPLPFASTSISFLVFMIVGPGMLVGLTLYLHIFLGHLAKLSCVAAIERTPSLFNLEGRVPSALSYLIFYWLPPGVVYAFGLKAAPWEEGAALFLLAALLTLVLLVLQLRRNVLGAWRGARLLLWLLVAATVFQVANIVSWAASERERRSPFQRAWYLKGADLAGAILHGSELIGANLVNANLQGADLTRAQLFAADLRGADLSGALLVQADLREADLRGARLKDADLTHANLRYARVDETDLRNPTLTAVQLQGVCFDSATLFNPGLRPERLPARCQGDDAVAAVAPPQCRPAAERPAPQCDLSVIGAILAPPGGYEKACLQACNPYYTDRNQTHTLAVIPPELQGGAWIKTTNLADKSEASERFLRFTIEPPAAVYVGFDSRLVDPPYRPPDWLVNGFERTALIIDINEPDPLQEFVVYRKVFHEAEVVLGGNMARGAAFGRSGRSNYVVVVKRLAAEGAAR